MTYYGNRYHPMAGRTALGAAGTIQQASYGGQRIPIHRLSRLVRGATPSASCWRCARTDVRCPKVGLFGSNAWNQLSNGRMMNKKIQTESEDEK